jgi:hypothetical protein
MSHVRTTKKAEVLLEIKKKQTGLSKARLVEYALLNLQYKKPKDIIK